MLGALIFACACLGACAGPRATRFEYAAPAMGTRFRLVLYAPDRALADRAAAAAFARIAALDACLSDYAPTSELNTLCRRTDTEAPLEAEVSPDLARVLALAQGWAERTAGAFDVTVGPYSRLWRRARRRGVPPAAAALREASASVGYRRLAVDATDRRVRFAASGMRLDLGAIGKGYALDAALATLRRHGLKSVLIDGGGDVLVGAAPPGHDGWRVVVSPAETGGPGEPVETGTMLVLVDAAVATSGDRARFLEAGGRRYSHLLDPRTGAALERRLQVSVLARDGATADALASAVSVLGPEEGLALVESIEAAGARVVGLGAERGRVWDTAAFRAAVSCAKTDASPVHVP